LQTKDGGRGGGRKKTYGPLRRNQLFVSFFFDKRGGGGLNSRGGNL